MNFLSFYLNRWRTSLATRFLLLIVGVTALTLCVATSFSYYSYRQLHLNNLQSKVEQLTEFVASISPDRIFSHDYSSLYNYVHELSQTEDIVYAVITDKNNEPLTAYLNKTDPIVADAISNAGDVDITKVIPYIEKQPDIFSVKTAINFNNKKIGQVILGATRSIVYKELKQILVWNIIGSGFIILLLSVGIYIVFRLNVLHPTKELMDGAQRVASGELKQPIKINSSDELGRLADSFNEMMRNLKQSHDERTMALDDLRDLNHTLELRVEERTKTVESINRELQQMALYDSLTNLPNRKLLHDRLEHMLETSKRVPTQFSVLLMDLDNFKEINDTFGHQTGDLLLKRVSKRLKSALRECDTVSRLGGDEFAILLPETDKEGAIHVCEKLLKSLGQSEDLQGVSISTSASLGISLYPEHGDNSNLLLKQADIAMYEAKQIKSGYSLYHRDIDTHSPSRIALMNDLRAAIETQQLQLYYQTITDISTGHVCGVEALARWIHPDQGFIPPDEFIPMIEKTGLIRPFTHWVIDTALKQWDEWQQQGIDVFMSVNLSMRNLQDKEFPNDLNKLIKKWSVTPHALLLEITESAMMSDPDYVLKTLNHFRNLGVDIAIDDFGTGYSSLSYLKKLPVSKLKIDRSFVNEMNHIKDDAMIVRSIIDLAHNLGLQVIAEGIENNEILNLLKELDCDQAQGYYFSRPVSGELVKFNITKPEIKQSIN